MDRIKEKLNSLRAEADAAVTRAEEAEAKNKVYEQELLHKDQEITSLQHRLSLRDSELEKTEVILAQNKQAATEDEQSRTDRDNLARKVHLLEEELDAAEKNLKETVEKLRQVDVKAEHFERQVQRLEQERDAWEKKYEDANTKYRETQKELDNLVSSLEGV